MKIEKTFTANIYVGLKVRDTGYVHPMSTAKLVCQEFVDSIGLCVSFTPTEFIYTNGGEPGVIVGLIQYPRFPTPEPTIEGMAIELAELLMKELQQYKVTIVMPDKTVMLENSFE